MKPLHNKATMSSLVIHISKLKSSNLMTRMLENGYFFTLSRLCYAFIIVYFLLLVRSWDINYNSGPMCIIRSPSCVTNPTCGQSIACFQHLSCIVYVSYVILGCAFVE